MNEKELSPVEKLIQDIRSKKFIVRTVKIGNNTIQVYDIENEAPKQDVKKSGADKS